MAELSHIIGYFLENYPHKLELSNARITKMIYLADWRAALTLDRQLSSVHWVFNHFGPYVADVVDTARDTPFLSVELTENIHGNEKTLLKLEDAHPDWDLSGEECAVIDAVMKMTRHLYWSDFIGLVYGTYPVVTQQKGSKFDLVELAAKYRREKAVAERVSEEVVVRRGDCEICGDPALVDIVNCLTCHETIYEYSNEPGLYTERSELGVFILDEDGDPESCPHCGGREFEVDYEQYCSYHQAKLNG